MPEGPARTARIALLHDLAAEGWSATEMKQALAENRLAFLKLDRVMTGEPRYTPREVATRTGVPLDLLLDMRQAIGLARPDPDERAFDDQDVRTGETFARLRAAGMPEDGMLEVSRVLGIGLAQVADAMRMVFARAVAGMGLDEHQVAVLNAQAAQELLPLMGPLMDHTLRLQLRDQIRNQQFGLTELEEGAAPETRHVWVGFADMVGFTRLGERVDVQELGGLAMRLNELALEAARAPVRLIKTVGDAAMFVSPSAGPLVDTALNVVTRADDEGEMFPSLRAGLAGGVAVSSGGDWYGRPVNLASRVTGVARPGSVLATREVRDAARAEYAWSDAGARELKGFKRRVPLYRVRRAERPDG